MKPKLKVGDYAEVIKSDEFGMRKGQKVKILSVDKSMTHPYQVTGSSWTMCDDELKKIPHTFDTLPPLTDIEQYRLSLEIMRTILVIEIAYNKKELANTINGNPSSHVDLVFFDMELNSELRLLTEILTP